MAATDKNTQYRVCIVGNLLGFRKGNVTTQGQILAELLLGDGHKVFATSSKEIRVFRLMDAVATVVRHRRKFDVVIIEVYSGLGFLLADVTSFVAQLLNTPTVFVLHGGDLPEAARRNRKWISRVFSRAQAIIAPSQYLARKISELGFTVHIIPNVLSIDEYPYEPPTRVTPKLIWMRSFHSIYRPEMAVQVLAELLKDYPDATLVMAGVDKGLLTSVKNRAIALGIGSSVAFPGFLDHEAKLQHFGAADVYINTNQIDNMPVSVLEALSFGLPVVATAVGGMRDLITDELNGILVPDGDVGAMADAIRRLVADPDLVKTLSANGRRLAEGCSWERVRDRWFEVFEELMQRPRVGPDAVSERTSQNAIS
jgi:glycosyltransferase involved in cell wall biosynthesis